MTLLLLLLLFYFTSAISIDAFPHKTCERIVRIPLNVSTWTATALLQSSTAIAVADADAVAVNLFDLWKIDTTLRVQDLGARAKEFGFKSLILLWNPEYVDSSLTGIVAMFDWITFECPITILYAPEFFQGNSIVDVKVNLIENPE